MSKDKMLIIMIKNKRSGKRIVCADTKCKECFFDYTNEGGCNNFDITESSEDVFIEMYVKEFGMARLVEELL